MKRANFGCLISVFACLPALSIAGETGLPSPVVPAGLGVATHFTDPSPGEMKRLVEAGYRMIRTDLEWGGVEKSPGQYDFGAYDRLMSHLTPAGVRPMFILDYGNRLYDQGRSPRSDAARAAFARFAAAAARHFRGQGVIWEIWNEPNIEQFWKPEPDAQAYARLALETARAVRAADPDAVILAPGSSELPWKFLETIFAADLLEHIDAVSVHPYRGQPPETARDDYGRLRALIARYASPARRMMPIVSSEWGYTTADAEVSEAVQANYLSRQWLANLAAGVNVSIFYDWRDDGDDPKDRESRFGTVRRNLEPKPSFLAAQALIRSLQGYTFRHRLQGATPADWTLLFQKADEPAALVVAEWSADPRGSAPRQTPRFRRIDADDPDASRLRQLADIRITPGPLVEKEGYPATLEVNAVNAGREAARVHLDAKAVDGDGKAGLDVTVEPGQRPVQSLVLPGSALRLEHRQVRLGLTWNDVALPAIAPLDVWRADPLLISAAPRGRSLQVTLENPAKGAFSGKLVVGADGKMSAGPAVQIGQGHAQALVEIPLQSTFHQISLVDDRGGLAAQTAAARYQAMSGFPAEPAESADLDAILFVDNSPLSPRPLRLLKAGAGAPVPFALEVPYHFDSGWRYLAVTPRRPLSIPAKAQAAILWVRGNESGDDLRCRFHDATGQMFQPDLGRLDGSGWRPLRVEFGPHPTAGHWGGADDGTPHLPLTWEALLLIDSSHRRGAGPQTVLVASPYYVLDR